MKCEYYLQLGGGISPWPGQGLAVTAPGCVELDQDPLLVVLDLLPPVGLCKLDHVLAAAGLRVGLATTTSSAASSLASRLFVNQLPGCGEASINQALITIIKTLLDNIQHSPHTLASLAP